jgi:hypothetical protein
MRSHGCCLKYTAARGLPALKAGSIQGCVADLGVKHGGIAGDLLRRVDCGDCRG